MDKSQGQVQTGAVLVRQGEGGTLFFKGGHCYVVKCPVGQFITGIVYFVTGHYTGRPHSLP